MTPSVKLTTSIGILYLFDLRLKEIIEVEKRTKKPLEEFGHEELFKFYIPLFSHLEQDLIGEKQEQPDIYTLKNEDVEKLSKNELEEIAKLFLKKVYFQFNNDKLSLKKDETYIECFYRLTVNEDKKIKEQLKKISSAFSPNLSKNILKTFKMSEGFKNSLSSFDKLGDSLKSFKTVIPDVTSFEQVKPSFPEIDFTEINRKKEERRLEPFKDLSSKMDMMIEAENKTITYMSNVYKTQVDIARELKTSSDSAKKYSKITVVVGIITVVLTVISMISMFIIN